MYVCMYVCMYVMLLRSMSERLQWLAMNTDIEYQTLRGGGEGDFEAFPIRTRPSMYVLTKIKCQKIPSHTRRVWHSILIRHSLGVIPN